MIKLKEHMNLKCLKGIKIIKIENADYKQDQYFYELMENYLSQALSRVYYNIGISSITLKSVQELKKIYSNLNVNKIIKYKQTLLGFKGNFTTLVFLERLKVLLLQNLNLLKNDLKTVIEQKRIETNLRKSYNR